MFPVCLLLLLPAIQSAETPNQFEILERVKLNVKAELAMSANYICVQTIERRYYTEKHACLVNGPHGKPKEFMRDRLRLDVAVSQGAEIFSWHGENRFVSSNISQVISDGPRTSGQFVGFLRNIFLNPGVQFTFKGTSQLKGKPIYTFDYVVQLLRSTYYLKGREDGYIIPYHGNFSVDAATFELLHLDIAADQVPMTSGICSAETAVDYQIVNISGQRSLLPSSFVLKMKGDHDLYTVNSNEYTQCREFRGASTLHFTVVDPAAPAVTHPVVDEQLPAGLIIKASLNTPVSDKDSYIGDAVEARLAEPLFVPGTRRAIPEGAILHGVISKMTQHSEGFTYWLFGIKFERLNAGDSSYLLNAWPLPTTYNNAGSKFSSDRVLDSMTMEAARQGLWFMDGAHFRLPKHFTRYWRTQELPKQNGVGSQEGDR